MTIPTPPARFRTPRSIAHWTFGPALALAWAVAILVVCWTPRAVLPVSETSASVPHHDKYIHAGIFGVYALLGTAGRPGVRRFAIILVSGVALAIISELGQELPLVGRDADVYDALADISGLLLGLGISLAAAWFLTQTPREAQVA